MRSGRRARVTSPARRGLAGDHVEARRAQAGAVFGQPCAGGAPQPRELARVDGRFGGAGRTAAAGLDLDEDDQPAAPRDQIDFDSRDARVACDDAVALGLEMARGERLAERAELAARARRRMREGHRAIPGTGVA